MLVVFWALSSSSYSRSSAMANKATFSTTFNSGVCAVRNGESPMPESSVEKAFAALTERAAILASPPVGAVSATRAEDLRLLYCQKQEWARHFNSLIWTITGILLPVSLAGLLVSFRNEAGVLNRPALICAALGSILLLLFWNGICNGHRKHWEREFQVAHVIEGAWGIRPTPSSIQDASEPLLSAGSTEIKSLRNWMALLGILVWVTRVGAELLAA